MLLGFGSIFRFLMISGIFMIYLIFTITLQSNWGDAVIIPISQKMKLRSPNGYKTPQGHRTDGCQSPLLAGPVSGCLTVVMGHQATAQMVSFTGKDGELY